MNSTCVNKGHEFPVMSVAIPHMDFTCENFTGKVFQFHIWI